MMASPGIFREDFRNRVGLSVSGTANARGLATRVPGRVHSMVLA